MKQGLNDHYINITEISCVEKPASGRKAKLLNWEFEK